jgi:protoporphyrinogen oxidase
MYLNQYAQCTMKTNYCVIVGGGICGLYSAILLADKFDHVYLIEKDSECGGLLKSVSDSDGNYYDQGTHIPNLLQVKEIDDILFGKEENRHDDWNYIGRPRTANYFQGQWNPVSPIVDARSLPEGIYQKGIAELLSLTEPSEAEDIVSYLSETIGPTFTTEAIAPIARKLYGDKVDLSQLTSVTSVSYFGLARVIALSPEVSNKLKELPVFDDKLAYHSFADYQRRIADDDTSLPSHYYPSNGKGVGHWVESLLKQAKDKGVEILNGESIKEINHQGKTIKSVVLNNQGVTLPCDYLFWTAQPVAALKAAGLEVKQRPLTFRTTCVFHFTVDKPLLNTTWHFVWNWDSQYKGFRVTLYPNLSPKTDDIKYKITVEVLCDPSGVDLIDQQAMYQELVDTGLVAEDASILSQHKQVIHNTFPVPTFEFAEAVKSNYDYLSATFDNIYVAGRFAGKSWFHGDVLSDVHLAIKAMFV